MDTLTAAQLAQLRAALERRLEALVRVEEPSSTEGGLPVSDVEASPLDRATARLLNDLSRAKRPASTRRRCSCCAMRWPGSTMAATACARNAASRSAPRACWRARKRVCASLARRAQNESELRRVTPPPIDHAMC
jgi:hypothetical protein